MTIQTKEDSNWFPNIGSKVWTIDGYPGTVTRIEDDVAYVKLQSGMNFPYLVVELEQRFDNDGD